MPDPDTGAVESVDAEVERVVELVLEHAVTQRPRESLMVVTASEKHAVRVMQAVLAAMPTHPELDRVRLGDRAGAVRRCCPIERAVAQSRDRVVFSLGYGRTPHGRVLSDFGALGQPGGERLLAVAMTRARRSLVIVTCFQPSDLDDGRMKHGAVALAEILDEVAAASRRAAAARRLRPDARRPARRLEARGLRVALGHRGKLGLVAANGGMCVVVETDAVLIGRSACASRCACVPRCCAASAGTTRACTPSSCSPTRTPSPTASRGWRGCRAALTRRSPSSTAHRLPSRARPRHRGA